MTRWTSLTRDCREGRIGLFPTDTGGAALMFFKLQIRPKIQVGTGKDIGKSEIYIGEARFCASKWPDDQDSSRN